MAEENVELTELADSLKPPFAPRSIPPKILSHHPLSVSQPSLPNGDINQQQVGQQPVLETAINIPLTADESLPTIAGKNDDVFLANDDIPKFLKWDLNLERLNRIHGLLWMAGRPMRARPLHRYRMMSFEVLHTDQLDLHLLKFSNKLIIKPLPEWMLSYEFWMKHICPDRTLHGNACGFILSYIWLLTTPLDLKLAHELHLLPSFVTWHWWKEFVKDFFGNVDVNSLHQVNKRFHFGDLRLGRINSIYRSRYAFDFGVRGYLYGYNRYVVFFQRNFSWILIVFVFFSLVLSAMQVGAGVEPLQKNQAYLRACYGFVVFSMVSVGAVLALVGVIFTFTFFYNMVSAIRHAKQKEKEREKLAEEKRNNDKDA